MKKIGSFMLIVLLSLFIAGCTPAQTGPVDENEEEEKSELLNEGELAVNFEFIDYQGNTVKLEDLKGDKVYLKFFASWCSICNRGMPELEELFASDRDYIAYAVVTPNANGEKSIEDFKAWFSTEEFPNIVVLFDVNAKFSRKLGAISVPTSVYIGSDGVLIKSKAGHSKNDEIEAFIKTFK
ncbi:MAG: thioredoxin [Firmicutes bacterium HGW-Firmicutes-20]|jgi:peptide methionine sulfoxide reductase msrA/msrB|nr:MAG: thioredoxin [Firmicutes bacterium HGW-Firmicutes-20]PKM90263.1 MAG: thioredoxin [Firmicutes bacterium HGW-Firmicutes-10]